MANLFLDVMGSDLDLFKLSLGVTELRPLGHIHLGVTCLCVEDPFVIGLEKNKDHLELVLFTSRSTIGTSIQPMIRFAKDLNNYYYTGSVLFHPNEGIKDNLTTLFKRYLNVDPFALG